MNIPGIPSVAAELAKARRHAESFAEVTGATEVTANLRKARKQLERNVELGLVKAGLFLQRESQHLVPVEFGVLRNTAGTRKRGSGFNTIVVVFYGTDYAVYVHENLEAAHGQRFNEKYSKEISAGTMHRRRPQEQAKFLEAPARKNGKRLAKIVRDQCRIQ